jgi:hypothetical protein
MIAARILNLFIISYSNPQSFAYYELWQIFILI